VDKTTNLEDDLQAMRNGSPAPPTPGVQNTGLQSPNPEPGFPSTQSRLANFLATRRPSLFGMKPVTPSKTILRSSTPNPNLPLDEQLLQERAAREQAEEKVASMTLELEELTQSLFEEANAMVRTEREKCARLELRLQTMESREEDKRRRLTELEKAIGRITRVRSLLEKQIPS
jgi:hypothetical protein